jgi:hypothetical protein
VAAASASNRPTYLTTLGEIMATPQPKSLREKDVTVFGDFEDLDHAKRVLRLGQRSERRAALRWLKKRNNQKATEQ